MNLPFSYTEFYRHLEFSLPASTVEQRKKWAATIIEKDIAIKDLSGLMKGEQKIAIRFLWLLTEIGELNANRLFTELPFLLELCEDLNPVYKTSFAVFWLVAGVPPENEGKAIDLLFRWLLSADTNVTIKSRSLLVLFKLTEKYPELRNELKLCLKDQMDKHTNDFKKRADKLLLKMEQ
jgi:hypothetical protein